MNFKTALFLFTVLIAVTSQILSQDQENHIIITGQMKNVMWNGELSGTIALDTISNKTGLYGMGPIEYLRGEILIYDGIYYTSKVLTDSTMIVEENLDLKAPFFAYTNITKWEEHKLPDSILTLTQFEKYLNAASKNSARPFMFMLSGLVESAGIHIVNLPEGTIVSSPDIVKKSRAYYTVNNEQSDILGFFSTEHQTIFTHHDTFLHMHLITANRKIMGHLDDAIFSKGSIKLLLPIQ